MNEQIITGIIVKTQDYKDNDRMVKIITADNILVTAIFKGVRKPKAKLKNGSNAFSFSEFTVVKKGEMYTVTGLNVIDTFFSLTSDFEMFTSASAMLEIAYRVCLNHDNTNIFLCIINHLKSMLYLNGNHKVVLLHFCLEVLNMLGYYQSFEQCSDCGGKLLHLKYYDYSEGILCSGCKNTGNIPVLDTVLAVLRITSDMPTEKVHSLNFSLEDTSQALSLIIGTLENKLSFKLKSID